MRVLFVFLVTTIFTVNVFGGPKFKESPELIEKGKKTYAMYCAVCHGANLDGNGPASADSKPRNFLKEPFKNGDSVESIEKSIRDGIPKTVMVAFPSIPEEERWGIAYYIKTMIAKAKQSH